MATHEVHNPWERYGWMMALIWLIFLVYPVITLLHSQADLGWIVLGWTGLVLFVVLYITGFIHGSRGGGGLGDPPTRRQWLTFVALIACALVTVPAVGGSALSFLPFIMSFASYGLTRAAHWVTTIGSFLLTLAAVILLPDGTSYLSVLAIVALLGVVNTVSTWLIVRSIEAEQLGRDLAMSQGRVAVARDVHDLIGHSLTVIGLKAQVARRLMDSDPGRAKAELLDIEALTAEAIAGVRASVADARASTLDDQVETSRDSLRAAEIDLEVRGDVGALSPAQALTASWILREATTNTLRHAQARHVDVLLAPGKLIVDDDGVGAAGPEGNGIRGMKERAAASGGALAVSGSPSGGTRVEVTW